MTEPAAPRPWSQAMVLWRQAGRSLTAQEAEIYRERIEADPDAKAWIESHHGRWQSMTSRSAIAKDGVDLCKALGVT